MFKRIIPRQIKSIIKPILRKIETNIYAGKKFKCPVCNFESKDFDFIGFDIPILKEKEVVGSGRRKARCYNCDSNDRERLIYTYLKYEENILNKKHYRIIHFAPEKNISSLLKTCNFKEYVCGDLHTKGYHYPNYVQNINLLNIPFENDYFDLIICNHILEHIPDDIKAMKEIYRVLKSSGKALLQVPIAKNTYETFEDSSIKTPKERENAFGQFDHVRIYGQDYVNKLESVGLKVKRINISNKYIKYGVNIDEDIFIAIK
ncbi:class I SAM-dependent methyltransferase [Tenacibaculum sp. C7A-26P2]|uniref:class I SAM-dependent methyltransferase n=1 Tax=Tenacibaculum sp. C7A-26P2 TaxID=3447504 RepID=UPI003F846F07